MKKIKFYAFLNPFRILLALKNCFNLALSNHFLTSSSKLHSSESKCDCKSLELSAQRMHTVGSKSRNKPVRSIVPVLFGQDLMGKKKLLYLPEVSCLNCYSSCYLYKSFSDRICPDFRENVRFSCKLERKPKCQSLAYYMSSQTFYNVR